VILGYQRRPAGPPVAASGFAGRFPSRRLLLHDQKLALFMPMQPTSPPLPDRPDLPDLIGQTLGNWRILRQLGAGAFGAVYEAQHVTIAERKAAVKVLHPHLSADQQLQKRFINEANAISRIEHQNIVQIYDGGTAASGICYVVMEFVAGHSLEHLLAAGALSPARAAHLGQQIASALLAAHGAGIVHRGLLSLYTPTGN
jgi:serine/threonine-protein kinase